MNINLVKIRMFGDNIKFLKVSVIKKILFINLISAIQIYFLKIFLM